MGCDCSTVPVPSPISPHPGVCTQSSCGTKLAMRDGQAILSHDESCSKNSYGIYHTFVVTGGMVDDKTWDFCAPCAAYYQDEITRLNVPVIEESPIP